jgi:hypothetical protein
VFNTSLPLSPARIHFGNASRDDFRNVKVVQVVGAVGASRDVSDNDEEGVLHGIEAANLESDREQERGATPIEAERTHSPMLSSAFVSVPINRISLAASR